MKASRLIMLAFVASAIAGFALAQAGAPSAGPTKNDYRIHLVAPVEGATITGTEIQVIVDTEIPAERSMSHDIDSTPHPDIDVFLDGMFRQTMRDDKNVVTVENVQPGPHTIVLLALNRSREVFDRKEINISVVAPPVPKAPPVAERPVKVAPAPAPAPAYVPPPPPAPVAAEMPKTGTSDPLLAAAGLALVLGGLAIRRFV
jgi:LPXTG-motif cell wall-anchored protein